ncbi:MAG: hypothetical protein QXW42_04425 [Thermofilum sp.]
MVSKLKDQNTYLTIAIPIGLKERLRKRAYKENKSISKIVVEALEAYLRELKEVVEK